VLDTVSGKLGLWVSYVDDGDDRGGCGCRCLPQHLSTG
jgi:hypothetical protein